LYITTLIEILLRDIFSINTPKLKLENRPGEEIQENYFTENLFKVFQKQIQFPISTDANYACFSLPIPMSLWPPHPITKSTELPFQVKPALIIANNKSLLMAVYPLI
jgi:hypothetical protein